MAPHSSRLGARRAQGRRRGPDVERSSRTIGVVGGGCSGALLAIELVERRGGLPRKVVVINSGSVPWRGVAYSTSSPSHLLNVPAGQMSAHAGRPDDLVEWARRRTADVTPASFLPRSLYGDYLSGRRVIGRRHDHPHPGRVVALEPTSGGTTTDLLLAGGSRVVVDAVVLATGNLPPGAPRFGGPDLQRSDRYVGDPWSTGGLEAVDGSVLLLGTGLTAVDVALRLDDLGFEGTIHAVSRHGLLPRRHLANPPLPSTAPSPAASETTVRGILAKLRGADREGTGGSPWTSSAPSWARSGSASPTRSVGVSCATPRGCGRFTGTGSHPGWRSGSPP